MGFRIVVEVRMSVFCQQMKDEARGNDVGLGLEALVHPRGVFLRIDERAEPVRPIEGLAGQDLPDPCAGVFRRPLRSGTDRQIQIALRPKHRADGGGETEVRDLDHAVRRRQQDAGATSPPWTTGRGPGFRVRPAGRRGSLPPFEGGSALRLREFGSKSSATGKGSAGSCSTKEGVLGLLNVADEPEHVGRLVGKPVLKLHGRGQRRDELRELVLAQPVWLEDNTPVSFRHREPNLCERGTSVSLTISDRPDRNLNRRRRGNQARNSRIIRALRPESHWGESCCPPCRPRLSAGETGIADHRDAKAAAVAAGLRAGRLLGGLRYLANDSGHTSAVPPKAVCRPKGDHRSP